MSKVTDHNEWQSENTDIFWNQIAKYDHVVQLYDNEGIFLDALMGFVSGINHTDENAVVIATYAHLNALESRMESYGMNVEAMISAHKFIPLNAHELLEEFMVNDKVDETLFAKAIADIFSKLGGPNKKFRAFGEMVAILWEQGNKEAALQIEQIWNKLCDEHQFSLFCAYPKKIFKDDEITPLSAVCCAHSKMISGSKKQLTQVHYRSIPEPAI